MLHTCSGAGGLTCHAGRAGGHSAGDARRRGQGGRAPGRHAAEHHRSGNGGYFQLPHRRRRRGCRRGAEQAAKGDIGAGYCWRRRRWGGAERQKAHASAGGSADAKSTPPSAPPAQRVESGQSAAAGGVSGAGQVGDVADVGGQSLRLRVEAVKCLDLLKHSASVCPMCCVRNASL